VLSGICNLHQCFPSDVVENKHAPFLSLSLSLSLLYKPIETHLVLLKYPLNISCVGAGFDLTIFNQFSFHN